MGPGKQSSRGRDNQDVDPMGISKAGGYPPSTDGTGNVRLRKRKLLAWDKLQDCFRIEEAALRRIVEGKWHYNA